MNIVVLQENITTALSKAGRFLPSKTSSVSSVNNFLLEVRQKEIFLSATDLETSIQIKIPGKVIEEGSVLLPAKTTQSLFPLFTGEKVVIRQEKKTVVVEGEKSKTVLKAESPESYPKEEEAKEGREREFSPEEMDKIINLVSFSVSSDQTRAVLTGILFSVKEEKTKVVATDGFRLSLYQSKKKKEGWSEDIILPTKAVRSIAELSDKEGVVLTLFEKERKIQAKSKNTTITTRAIDGAFPDYNKILPTDNQTTVEIDRKELLEAVKIASVFARESSNIIKFSLGKEKLVITANAVQTGENKSEIAVKTQGEAVDTAFNYRFLLDILTASPEETIFFETNGPLQPGLFHFGKKEEYMHVIMPVRLQDAK